MLERVQLVFKFASELLGSQDVGLLVLVDKEEKRQVVVSVGKEEIKQFQIRMQKKDTTTFLPEVFVNLSKDKDLLDKYDLEIVSVEKGQYHVTFSCLETNEQYPLRVSDAILLSFIADIPIYMSKELMKKQSAPYSPNASAMALPINTISTEMLQSALDKAIENEDYKIASYLRDEIKNRETPKQED